jgi:hypothetical protein
VSAGVRRVDLILTKVVSIGIKDMWVSLLKGRRRKEEDFGVDLIRVL